MMFTKRMSDILHSKQNIERVKRKTLINACEVKEKEKQKNIFKN